MNTRRHKRKKNSPTPSDSVILAAKVVFVVFAVALAGGLVWVLNTFRFHPW